MRYNMLAHMGLHLPVRRPSAERTSGGTAGFKLHVRRPLAGRTSSETTTKYQR